MIGQKTANGAPLEFKKSIPTTCCCHPHGVPWRWCVEGDSIMHSILRVSQKIQVDVVRQIHIYSAFKRNLICFISLLQGSMIISNSRYMEDETRQQSREAFGKLLTCNCFLTTVDFGLFNTYSASSLNVLLEERPQFFF